MPLLRLLLPFYTLGGCGVVVWWGRGGGDGAAFLTFSDGMSAPPAPLPSHFHALPLRPARCLADFLRGFPVKKQFSNSYTVLHLIISLKMAMIFFYYFYLTFLPVLSKFCFINVLDSRWIYCTVRSIHVFKS